MGVGLCFLSLWHRPLHAYRLSTAVLTERLFLDSSVAFSFTVWSLPLAIQSWVFLQLQTFDQQIEWTTALTSRNLPKVGNLLDSNVFILSAGSRLLLYSNLYCKTRWKKWTNRRKRITWCIDGDAKPWKFHTVDYFDLAIQKNFKWKSWAWRKQMGYLSSLDTVLDRDTFYNWLRNFSICLHKDRGLQVFHNRFLASRGSAVFHLHCKHLHFVPHLSTVLPLRRPWKQRDRYLIKTQLRIRFCDFGKLNDRDDWH